MFVDNRRISVAFRAGAKKVLYGLMVLMMCGIFSCEIASVAHAGLLYYEGFDYATGDVTGNNSNSTSPAAYKFNGGWYDTRPTPSGDVMVTESNLTLESGNAVTVTPTSGTTIHGLRLGDATGENPVTISDILPENDTLWFGYLLNLAEYGGRFCVGGFRSAAGTSEELSLGAPSSVDFLESQYQLNARDTFKKVFGDLFDVGVTKLVVLKMVLDDTDPSLTFWTLDPTAVPAEENLGEGTFLNGTSNVPVAGLLTVDTFTVGSGYDGGDWTTSIGIFDEFAIGTEYLDVVSPPSDDPIAGDANKDGKVDGSDVTILAGNWQKGVSDGLTAIWNDGDFNNDGKVDGSDVTILAGNWQAGVSVSSAAASVPEPSMLVLLLAAMASWFVVRRR